MRHRTPLSLDVIYPAWRLESHTANRYPPTLTDGEETSFADFFVFAPAVAG